MYITLKHYENIYKRSHKYITSQKQLVGLDIHLLSCNLLNALKVPGKIPGIHIMRHRFCLDSFHNAFADERYTAVRILPKSVEWFYRQDQQQDENNVSNVWWRLKCWASSQPLLGLRPCDGNMFRRGPLLVLLLLLSDWCHLVGGSFVSYHLNCRWNPSSTHISLAVLFFYLITVTSNTLWESFHYIATVTRTRQSIVLVCRSNSLQ